MGTKKTIKAASPAEAQEIARYVVSRRYEYFGSWADVAGEFKVNRGLLCAISKGKRKASARVLLALGIVAPIYSPAPCCPVCGVVHIRKTCPEAKRESATRKRRVRYSERAVASFVSTWQQAVIGILLGGRS